MTTPASERKPWLHGLLFALTFLTTWFAGLLYASSFLSAGGGPGVGLFDLRSVRLGLFYALPLMIILTGHELGHFLTCRRYGVLATYPYFIPGPPVLGTFGAFIRMKSHVFFKHQIFDIGANGPLTGFLLALPVLIAGLGLSRIVPLPATSPDMISFGEPLLLKILSGLFFGRIPEGSTLNLHPAGFAGWVGLLVTAVNLLPIGQLDGGHVAYAVLGRRTQWLSRSLMGLLALMGLFFHTSWLLFAVVILIIELRSKTRLRHPPVFDEAAPLDAKRRVRSLAIVVIFVLSFIPDPIKGFSLLDLVTRHAGRL
jgi:membrane-associated protease RseP (regulator of RpoE activity)